MQYKLIKSVAGLEKKEYKAARIIAAQTGQPVAIRFSVNPSDGPHDRIKIVEPSGKVREAKTSEFGPNFGFA